MMQKELNSFLKNIFESNIEFAKVFGTNSLMDAKVMLVADAISEDVELLSEVIKECCEEERKIYNKNRENRVSALMI